MSWINDLFNSKRSNVQLPVTGDGLDFFYTIGCAGASLWGASEHLNDFLEVPELNAIVMWKARAWSSMRLKVVSNTTDKEVTNNDYLVRVIRNPNYFQSQKEFLMQTKIWQEVFGNEYIYMNTPAGMSNSYLGMFTLNPAFVDIEYNATNKPFYLMKELSDQIKYKSTWGGTSTDITNNVIHINNSNVDPDSSNWLDGLSPLEVLKAPIENIRASYEARNVIISNRGALGILSNGSVDGLGSTMPMDSKEKASLQDALKGYGLSKNQHQFILTNLNLKWQQMAVDSDKLQLHKECEESFKTICHVLGVNYEIFSNDNTYENKRAAELATYQNTIIPEAEEWVSALNRKLGTDKKSWHISCSFDHLPIFAENIKDRSDVMLKVTTALSKAFIDGAISIQEYKTELGKLKIGINE